MLSIIKLPIIKRNIPKRATPNHRGTIAPSDLLIQSTLAQTNSADIEAMLPDIDVTGAMKSASIAVMTKYGGQFGIIFALILVPFFLGLVMWIIFYIGGKIRRHAPK